MGICMEGNNIAKPFMKSIDMSQQTIVVCIYACYDHPYYLNSPSYSYCQRLPDKINCIGDHRHCING